MNYSGQGDGRNISFLVFVRQARYPPTPFSTFFQRRHLTKKSLIIQKASNGCRSWIKAEQIRFPLVRVRHTVRGTRASPPTSDDSLLSRGCGRLQLNYFARVRKNEGA